jgi:hypothetical protein
MSRFFSLSIILMILFAINPTSLAKSKAKVFKKISVPNKLLFPTKPALIPSSFKSPLDTIPNEILQAIKNAKKYKDDLASEKSQLETQAQYEARVAASLPNNLRAIDLVLPVEEIFNYDAEKQTITISINGGHSFDRDGNEFKKLMAGYIRKDSYKNNVTCTNGYGASFKYLNTTHDYNNYIIAYSQKDISDNLNSITIPMSVSEARNYITLDEKKLNTKLKFSVKLKPIFPFYKEDSYYRGNECGDKYNDRGGTNSIWTGNTYSALFSIINFKLIDSSSGQVWFEKDYTKP